MNKEPGTWIIKHEIRISKSETNPKFKCSKFKTIRTWHVGFIFCFGHLYFGHLNLFRISIFGFRIYLSLS